MFERYTEKARRVIFFARYEASQLGSISIETEHLLLGLIREGKGLTSRIFARSHLSLENIRKEIEGRTVFREKVSTSIDLPLSNECKRILAYAAEEAERRFAFLAEAGALLAAFVLSALSLARVEHLLALVRERERHFENAQTAPVEPPVPAGLVEEHAVAGRERVLSHDRLHVVGGPPSRLAARG